MQRERLERYLDRLDRAVMRLAKLMAQQGAGPLASVSLSQMIVLRALRRKGSAPVSDVAACLGVSLAAATGMVDRLVAPGWVVRERDDADRRVVWVRLTPEGEAALLEAETHRRQALAEIYNHLSEEDMATLVRILEKVTAPNPVEV